MLKARHLQEAINALNRIKQEGDSMLATTNGETERLRALLEQNPVLRGTRTNYQGVPLISLAAAEGHIDTVQLLLEMGCSLGSRDLGHIRGPGKTPLLAAAKAGQAATVVWLLEHGADVNDSGGAQMLSPQALDAGWPEERHRQQIHGREDGDWNDSGWTALMHAADSGNAALCAALLWRGADPGRRSRHGLSALDLAHRGCLAAQQTPDQAAVFHECVAC